MPNCTACTLCVNRTQVVFPTDCPVGGLLCIGEAPGAEEDRIGQGFMGAAGKRLDSLLGAHGLTRGKDYGVANICRCRPADNRKPSKMEISFCLPKLIDDIRRMQPSVLLFVGAVPSAAFLGARDLFSLITKPEAPRYFPGIAHQIPMPHTSGLSWNRYAPNGEPWREIGARQVASAVEALRAAK